MTKEHPNHVTRFKPDESVEIEHQNDRFKIVVTLKPKFAKEIVHGITNKIGINFKDLVDTDSLGS
ncbi:hypothetical protein ACFL5S_02225 [Fibrobacterota bacterium]